jgi:hypothetical protein
MQPNQNNSNQGFFKRAQFSSGQRIYASDLQEIEGYYRNMRWLHNKCLHQSGIGSGFAVRGEIGDRVVRVEPGYAIDSEGREIVLTRTKILPVPPSEGGKNDKPALFDLAVSYPNENLEEVETRQGICHARGTTRLQEEPIFCWVELNNETKEPSGDHGDERQKDLLVTIMRAEIQNCRLKKNISIARRQNAKPKKHSNIVSGSYFPEPKEWKLWKNEWNDPLGFVLKVDTSSAKFTTPPDYFAEIVGNRFVSKAIDQNIDEPYMLEGFTNTIIDSQNGEPSKIDFDIHIFMPEINDWGISVNPAFFLGNNGYSDFERQHILHRLGWHVKWIGIEG